MIHTLAILLLRSNLCVSGLMLYRERFSTFLVHSWKHNGAYNICRLCFYLNLAEALPLFMKQEFEPSVKEDKCGE